MNLNLIKTPADIFRLDYLKIRKLEGWGELSIKNLQNAIDKSKNIMLDKFIYSIGIRHIGQENAKIIGNFFKKSKHFQNYLMKKRAKILQNLEDLNGIGDTQIRSIDDFFSNKKTPKLFNL